MFKTVRLRLTLWYLLSFGALLIAFSIGVYALLSRELLDRFDKSLANVGQNAASVMTDEIRENGDPIAGSAEALKNLKLPDVYLAFFHGDQMLVTNYPNKDQLLFTSEILELARSNSESDSPVFVNIHEINRHRARAALRAVRIGNETYIAAAFQSLHDVNEQLEFMRDIFYVGIPVALIVAGIGGYLLAHKSLSPIVAMTVQAQLIGTENMHERLRVANPNDELGSLTIVFNQLLDRLETSFESMRRFMADASHELRTPIAIIRGEADVSLSKERQTEEYKDALTTIQDESRRLTRIVDDLMALSRANTGERLLKVENIYLNDVVDECVHGMQVIANTKGIALTNESQPDIAFKGDEELLRRMIMNLLDNAIKYNTPAGRVKITLKSENSHAKISVADTGIGIPAEAASQVFDRFYRVDQSRSRSAGGSGLGLAIAKWIAEAHQGTINLASDPGKGSTFTVSLPL